MSKENIQYTSRIFDPNKSIILIGMNGVGKSTLGLLGSVSLHKRFIDLENFNSTNASSSGTRTDGTNTPIIDEDQYLRSKQEQFESIKSKVDEFKTNSIIVLPSSCVDYQVTVDYLYELNQTHPIIHIQCEESRILGYLEIQTQLQFEKFKKMFLTRLENYRKCSNFDFFNRNSQELNGKDYIDDLMNFNNNDSKFLALKSTELDFLKFIKFIQGEPNELEYKPIPEFQMNSTCVLMKFPNMLNNELNIIETSLGCDCIEIVLNLTNLLSSKLKFIQFDEFISKIRRFTEYPILLTIEDDLNTILSSNLFNFYIFFLTTGIRLGLEYINLNFQLFELIEMEQADLIYKTLINAKGHTRIMGSYKEATLANFWTSSKPYIICEKFESLKVDLIRISKTSIQSNLENIDATSFRRTYSKNIPISCFNETQLGHISKFMNTIMTPVLPTLKDPSEQLSVKKFQRGLFNCCLIPKLQFYEIGSEMSIIPQIQNANFDQFGLLYNFQHAVQPIPNLLTSPNFGGITTSCTNISLIDYCDEISMDSRAINSVNTIVSIRSPTNPFKIDKIRGYNTNWIAVRQCILENTSPVNSVNKSTSSLIVGAGSIGRACVYALVSLGITKIFVWDKDLSQSKELGEFYKGSEGFEVIILESLVSGLPMGQNTPTVIVINDGEVMQLIDDWFGNKSGGVIVETNLHKIMKPEFREKGWIEVDGLSVLSALCKVQFEIFTRKLIPGKLMKKVVVKNYVGSQDHEFW